MSRKHLSTYLNDHLAGSVAAVEILDRLMQEAEDLAPLLGQLKRDIEWDREQLKNLMSRLKIAESPLRKAGGWIAERMTEMKLEIDDDSRGRLRRLELLEALVLGIGGKLALWKALNAASVEEGRLQGLDYGILMQRAKEQRDRADELRMAAARQALTLAA